MEIVTFEEGDTNDDLIRKLKAAKGPVEIHFKACGGEIASEELIDLMKEKVAVSRLDNLPSIATMIAMAGNPKEQITHIFGYKIIE